MLEIVSVAAESPYVQAARKLFAEYREFLKTIESTHCFNFDAYQEEIGDLPASYSENEGEVLLAVSGGVPAGCIAYRAVVGEEGRTCEMKRLFVTPDFRGRGIARKLIEGVLRRAAARGFSRSILDTDVASMEQAYATYSAMGFKEYKISAGSIHFLERSLDPTSKAGY